jgi:class 3 adenylate cyclase
MGLSNDLSKEVDGIFRNQWSSRDGQDVPETEDVQLGNYGVKLEGTVLYADLAQSTQLVANSSDTFAAEVYKAYLTCSCKIISNSGGVITAFDGDRVMAVYIGSYKNTSAAKTALRINYAVQSIINPKIKEIYPSKNYTVRQTVGVDTGNLFIARTGIRGSNDLVWVGRAANYAAKLCSLREEGYSSYITAEVFNSMHESAKYGGNPLRVMWEKRTWHEFGIEVYRSHWSWSPD